MSGKKFALMGSTFLTRRGGAGYRPSIRPGKHGHPMRDPDGHGDAEFDAFSAAGDVEVGKPADGIETNQPEKEAAPEKPAKAAKPAKPATAAKPEPKPAKPAAAAAAEPAEGAEDEGAEGADDDEEIEEDDAPKPKPKASERIRELNKRLRQEERLRLASDVRLDALEKRLQGGGGDGNSSAIGEAPDPRDTEKYPLGHLDDRYIEDKLEWLAETKAAGKADAVLQRQQEGEQQRQAEQAHAQLLEKVDDLSTRGTELYDDFQEAVVDAGMRGDWRLDQPTFEAAHEADNGAQILYELSQDKAEAKRVAALTPYQQMKFVMDRDAEIGKGKQPRRIPRAGEPPATQTRGANSRTRIDPATSNLDDFEKAWEADAKGK